MEPTNGRRIVRALEVVALTGEMPGELTSYDDASTHYPVRYLGVDRPDLAERIAVRADRMWAQGLVDEVRRLERDGQPGARLRAGPGAARRPLRRRAGPGGDRRRDPPLRPPPARLVHPRPAHPLAGARRRPAGAGAVTRLMQCAATRGGHRHEIGSHGCRDLHGGGQPRSLASATLCRTSHRGSASAVAGVRAIAGSARRRVEACMRIPLTTAGRLRFDAAAPSAAVAVGAPRRSAASPSCYRTVSAPRWRAGARRRTFRCTSSTQCDLGHDARDTLTPIARLLRPGPLARGPHDDPERTCRPC